MAILQVGKPYNETKKHWPEGIDYNFRSGQHELRIFYRTPSRAEINSIWNGPAIFSLSVIGPNIILAFKFEGFNWQDASYNWHLVPEEQRKLPDIPTNSEQRAAITIILVDAETGIIKAIRFSSFSHKFTVKLHEAIIKQSQEQLPADYDEQTQKLVENYTPEYLVKNKSIARCRLGD